MKTNTITLVAQILSAVGAVNWGLVGLAQFNLVTTIFGEMTTPTRAVYALVGLSGVALIGQVIGNLSQDVQVSANH